MGKLIIVTGKTGSGKSVWIEKWRRADPENRVHAKTLGEALKELAEGRDCAMEISIPNHEIVLEVIA